MKELYNQFYGEAGWFSNHTKKEQWFKQSFAPSGVIMLSASMDIGFEIETPVQEVLELSASMELGFEIETVVSETPGQINLSASLPIGFEMEADLGQEPDDSRVVGGGFLGKWEPKKPIFLKAKMEIGFDVRATTRIEPHPIIVTPMREAPSLAPALPDYRPVIVHAMGPRSRAMLEPAPAIATPTPEVSAPPAPAPAKKRDWARIDAEDLLILTS